VRKRGYSPPINDGLEAHTTLTLKPFSASCRAVEHRSCWRATRGSLSHARSLDHAVNFGRLSSTRTCPSSSCSRPTRCRLALPLNGCLVALRGCRSDARDVRGETREALANDSRLFACARCHELVFVCRRCPRSSVPRRLAAGRRCCLSPSVPKFRPGVGATMSSTRSTRISIGHTPSGAWPVPDPPLRSRCLRLLREHSISPDRWPSAGFAGATTVRVGFTRCERSGGRACT
jgi:hypothetical protein